MLGLYNWNTDLAPFVLIPLWIGIEALFILVWLKTKP